MKLGLWTWMVVLVVGCDTTDAMEAECLVGDDTQCVIRMLEPPPGGRRCDDDPLPRAGELLLFVGERLTGACVAFPSGSWDVERWGLAGWVLSVGGRGELTFADGRSLPVDGEAVKLDGQVVTVRVP